jgi:hypothetical protein
MSKQIKIELLGDTILACNIIRTFYYNPELLHNYNQVSRIPAIDFHIMLEMGWYISLLPFTKNKDIFYHHILSIILGIYGYYHNITYLGFTLLSIMIWSNLFLGIMRITHYKISGYCFAMVFFIFRIIIFPFWFMPKIVYLQTENMILYYTMNSGLSMLMLMQFFWFGKILSKILT